MKTIKILLCSMLCISLCSCSNNNSNEQVSVTETNAPQVAPREDVTFTIPVELLNGEEPNLDEVNENYVKEVTKNEDGSYTITLTADGHEELITSITDQLNNSCVEILNDKENYPNIEDIQHNADFTEFTIVCSSQNLNMGEGFISLSMMFAGAMFQIFNGVDVDSIDVKVTYKDSSTDQEFDSYSFRDTLQQMSENTTE